MFHRGQITKSISVLSLGVLAACSGGGDSTQSNLPGRASAAAFQAADPAAAADAAARTTSSVVSTLATTIQSCTLTSPCISGTNTSTGAGVAGISSNGRGVNGSTKHNSTASSNAMFGVYGQDLSTSGSYDGGVFGTSVRGYGVYGQSSSNDGIRALSSSGPGLYASSSNGYGALAFSTSSYGFLGESTQFIGVYGFGPTDGVYGFSSSGSGLYGSGSSGTAVYANSSTGYGLQAHTGGHVGAYVTNTNGNGADVTGSYVGLVARAPAGSGFPLVATDSAGNNLFYVDGAGNIYYHGTANHFLSVQGAATATAFGPSSTRPSIEDTGTAHLISGRAIVTLDPTFARAIDTGRRYQVFLTPGGDTRGLYVAGKSTSSFLVREVQGGHGTFDFDYHVYATALGAANVHMTMATPKVPVLRIAVPTVVKPPATPPQL